MPLKSGYTNSTVGRNIKIETQAGKKRDQAIAIALSKKREACSRLAGTGRKVPKECHGYMGKRRVKKK